MHRLLAASLVLTGCTPGNPPAPRSELPVLGPETISIGNVYRGTFTPDGDTLYFFKNVVEGQEEYRIFRSSRSNGEWSIPERVDLGGEFSDLYPAITPDGQRMVFSSYRAAPGDTSSHSSSYLWYVAREGGRWGRPVYMSEATEVGHYHSQPIFDARGDLYFSRSSWDYRGHSEHVSRWDGVRYAAPDTAPAWVYFRGRMAGGRHLYETTPGYTDSYLLLAIGERPDTSTRPGPPDLYVSLRREGRWTDPQRLQGGVATPETENFAFYGPGGRELYFVRQFARIHHLPLEQALGSRTRP